MMRRLVLLVCLLGVVVSPSSASAPAALKVVARNLDNPRKLSVGADGAVYVVESGKGGTDTCTGTGTNVYCAGRSGAITRVAPGPQQRVVTGLVSWAMPTLQRAQGAADVLASSGTYYVLLGDFFTNAVGDNPWGRDGAMAGKLIATTTGKVKPKVIADLAAFEVAHNPDRGAGPGARFGDPAIDSNPYAFVAYRGGFAVVDAAGNDLLWVSPKGKISVLAVFPIQTEKLTKAVGRSIGAPPTMTSIKVQSVPSCVAVGPDGALYVGELTGRPFQPGKARVWRVVPGKRPSVYAAGFTTIVDLAFAGSELLVLETADKGLYDPRSTGALIRLAPDGTRSVLAAKGLVYPTGLVVAGRTVYVSNYGFLPGSGPGPHGEVIALQK